VFCTSVYVMAFLHTALLKLVPSVSTSNNSTKKSISLYLVIYSIRLPFGLISTHQPNYVLQLTGYWLEFNVGRKEMYLGTNLFIVVSCNATS
jgi:hypothetical protein